MKQDDLMTALERLLDPADDAATGSVVPYWSTLSDAESGLSTRPEDSLPADLARFLSDGLAAPAALQPSLADMAAYVDGRLEGPEREAFETALVASPELRADVDMLARAASLLDDTVEPSSGPASPQA